MKTFLFLFLAAVAFADGGDHGNGGDTKPFEYGSAWFLGTGKVFRYCILRDKTFGVSTDTVSSLIPKVISTWKDYFMSAAAIHFRVPDLTPTFDSKEVGCNDKDLDLKFYFGSTSDEVEKAKIQYVDPVGFAEKTSYKVEAGWGKGFVWIAPPRDFPRIDWTIPYSLEGILLHEMGHVFGCEHVSGTIMSQDIAKLLSTGIILTKVDHSRELVHGSAQTFEGTLDKDGASVFSRLAARSPSGEIKAKYLNDYRLTLTDDYGANDFDIQMSQTFPQIFPDDAMVFKTVGMAPVHGKKVRVETWLSGGEGFVNSGTIKSKSGEIIPIVIFRNTSDSPVVIKGIFLNEMHTFFLTVSNL